MDLLISRKWRPNPAHAARKSLQGVDLVSFVFVVAVCVCCARALAKIARCSAGLARLKVLLTRELQLVICLKGCDSLSLARSPAHSLALGGKQRERAAADTAPCAPKFPAAGKSIATRRLCDTSQESKRTARGGVHVRNIFVSPILCAQDVSQGLKPSFDIEESRSSPCACVRQTLFSISLSHYAAA